MELELEMETDKTKQIAKTNQAPYLLRPSSLSLFRFGFDKQIYHHHVHVFIPGGNVVQS